MRRREFWWIVFLGLWALFSLAPAGQPAVVAAQDDPVIVRITPAEAQVTTEGTFAVALEIVDVTDLYAFAVVLAFDPAVVQVVDVDPLIDGVQMGLGTFMEPGVAILNLANNPAGVIEFAFTQLNPSPPKSGSGNLMVITFTGVAEGEVSPLIFMDLQLAQPSGIGLAAEGIPGEITVLEQSPPGPTATVIPTLPVGTTLPTATFAPTLPATTPIPLSTSTSVASPPPAPTATSMPAVATSNPSGMTPTPGMTAAEPTAQSTDTGAAISPTTAPGTAVSNNPTTQPATIAPGATLALAVAQDEAVGDEAAPSAEPPAVPESATTENSDGATASDPASPIGQGEGASGATNGSANGGLGNTAENRDNPGIWLIGLGLLLVLLGAGFVIFLRSRQI